MGTFLRHSVYSFCEEKEQVLSVTQPEVIDTHVRNLTSDFHYFVQNALKRWFTGEMFASYRKLGSLNRFPVTKLLSSQKSPKLLPEAGNDRIFMRQRVR